MAKRQSSKRQPLVRDICPACKKPFKFYTDKPRGLAEAAVYIGIADVWLHADHCHTEYYKTIAWEKRKERRW